VLSLVKLAKKNYLGNCPFKRAPSHHFLQSCMSISSMLLAFVIYLFIILNGDGKILDYVPRYIPKVAKDIQSLILRYFKVAVSTHSFD
jgi:hypothetical protein